MNIDRISKTLYKALNTLFLHSPLKTSLGGIFGGMLSGISEILTQLKYIDLSMIGIGHYILIGIGTVYLPSIFMAFLGQDKLPEDVERAFNLLDKLYKEGKITKEDRDQRYLRVCEKIIENVVLNESTQKELDKLKRSKL